MISSLERPMTKEESYVQRRQLFKTIWDTALDINAKEDILFKPKVIKTLRMDEIDKCPVGKSKKERIRNLRHVCNRILDFCNRQDADDIFYERIAAAGGASKIKETSPKASPTKPKRAKARVKRKFRKVKSMTLPNLQPNTITVARMGNKESKSNVEDSDSSDSSSQQPTKRKHRKNVKRKTNKVKTKKSVRIKTDDFPKEGTSTKRKVIKKKRIGRGKKLKSAIQQASPQIISV